eukprot:1109419-Pleurochrysis_carterae.AAC.1
MIDRCWAGCWRNNGWQLGLHIHLLRYRGKAVARSVRYKRTSDAFDFREDRLIELDIVEANGGDAVDLKQVNKVAAAALVDVKMNAFCSYSRCELAWLLCFAPNATSCAAEERAELVNVRLRA